MAKVSLRYCDDYKKINLEASLKKAFEDIGGLESFIQPKSKVLLKCDLSNREAPDMALSTHPNLVAVIADMIEKLGATCIIADNPKEYSASNVEKMYEKTKMLEVSNQGHAQLNNSFDLYQKSIDGNMTTELVLLNTLKSVDAIINIPKLIVDEKEGFEGCIHNLFGLLASEQQEIIRKSSNSASNFADYMLDVYKEIENKLILNVVDGIVAREANNCQRILNLIAVGKNAINVDYTLLKIVNINQDENALIKQSKNCGLIKDDLHIETLGDDLKTFIRNDFALPTQNENITPTKVSRDYLSIQERPKVIINECKGCKTCFSVCPTNAISEGRDENGEIYARIDLLKCIHCMQCVNTCPYSAIKILTPAKAKTLKQKMNKRIVNKN